MIELTGLHKAYGAQTILSDASLAVRAGESIALVGTNGSGKTTTLRCAVGLARADGGRVAIDGIDMAARPCDARARLSYLAQRTCFPATLTVREILSMVAELRRTDVHAVAREISLCGLSHVAGRTVGRLSGGEAQRLAIAALFIPDAAAYLLDEPTMNLDPSGVRLLVDRLAAARRDGRAILFTTHATAELEELATAVAVLRNGRISPVTEGTLPGERHLSMVIEGNPDVWLDAALRNGARRAWPRRSRLHVLIADGAVSALLARLESDGARVVNYRSETVLSAALERLNEEEHHDAVVRPHSVERCVAAGRLWHGASWARADTVGPR
ncbi:MAG TPA: ABC transporter ATP-binding protein [Vicinamibacterales bacterium]|nr:ABC transporter ATP-binding protein [Vicinamibacterales bacterium]